MVNTSSSGGYLSPVPPDPVADEEMVNAIQETVVGLTGLDPTLVRPRWQAKPPTQPPVDTDWCSVGKIRRSALDFPVLQYHPSTNNIELQRHEKVEFMASFYGPNDDHFSGVLRDGLYIPQNLEYLGTFGIKLYESLDTVNNPELINGQWVGRTDVEFVLVRQLNRYYQVLNILSAKGFVRFTSQGTDGSAPWIA